MVSQQNDVIDAGLAEVQEMIEDATNHKTDANDVVVVEHSLIEEFSGCLPFVLTHVYITSLMYLTSRMCI